MLTLLQQMVAEDPTRADAWRLIGRIHRKHNRLGDAIGVVRHALALQPDNIAAHADLAELFLQVGDRRAAEFHFDQVMRWGPESSYAADLVARDIRAAPPPLQGPGGQTMLGSHAPFPDNAQSGSLTSGVAPAGYEIQTFDGADDLQHRLDQVVIDASNVSQRVRVFIETGTLYNTNVSLTPISRRLADEDAASFQGFLSPDVEWIAASRGPWRAGPLARGYFTVNESNFSALDLASFQPGGFLERDLPGWGASELVGRVDYVYSLDLLGGSRFGDRHSITASLTTILPQADVLYAYFTTSLSNFSDDGAFPEVDSLDGTSFTGGLSRFFNTDTTWLPTWSLGVDLESADTEGADYRYQSVNLHGDMTFALSPRLSFIPRGGVGYRTYGDFTGPVSRDEFIWRAEGRLRWKWTESLSISAVAGHQRFASDNEDFDSERTEGGIVLTFLR